MRGKKRIGLMFLLIAVVVGGGGYQASPVVEKK